MASSEVYGFVEETSRFIRMNGDQIIEGRNGKTQGQIFILDQESGGDLDGITAMYYDGTLIVLEADDIQESEITSRDIDRQNYPIITGLSLMSRRFLKDFGRRWLRV